MRSHTIDVDGPVHYLEYAGPEDGPTFVCVHGLGGSHANWLALAPGLARRGRVLVPDLRGFGHTPLGANLASVQANRVLLDRFCEAMDANPAILLGNSMGGAISIMQAHARPEAVAGLVLIDPAVPRPAIGGVDPQVAATFAAYMIPRVGESFIDRRLARLGPERIAKETLRLCTVSPARVPPEVVEASVAMARERAASMPWATTAFLQAARSLVRLLGRPKRFYRMMSEVTAPALLIMGRYDRLVPLAAAEIVAGRRPDWDFVVFDDLGHVPMMEDAPGTLAAIERWLDATAAALFGRRAGRA